MKKLLLFFALLLAILPAAAETFEKVTDYSTLQDGDEIIVVVNYMQVGSSNPHFNGYMGSGFKCVMTEATAAYGDSEEITTENGPQLITLEASGNSNYPWLLKVDGTYIQSTATSSKNGIGTVDAANDACQIKFQTGTKNHEFNNSSAGTRKYLRANMTDGKKGTTQITSGASNLGAKPEIYRLKKAPLGPVDFTYPYEASKTLVIGTDEEFTIPMPEVCPANISWTSSDKEEAVISLENSYMLVVGEGSAVVTATWQDDEAFKAGSFEYTINVVTPPAAGTPVVTINGKTLEANAFYNVTKGAVATITSENAKEIYVYNEYFADIKTLEGASCELPIELDGEYYINASNGIDENKGISINFKLVEPGEPVETIAYVWRKVTSIEDVTADGEYVIVNESSSKAASNADNTNNRKTADVVIADGEISEMPKDALLLNVEAAEDGYYWTVLNYLGSTDKGVYLISFNDTSTASDAKSTNQLKIGAKNDNNNVDVAKTSLAINNGNAVITFVNCKFKNTAKSIQKNKTSDLFSTYASEQNPIQLYKKTEVKGEPEIVISLSEYLPKIGETEHLVFANDEVAKKMTFTSLIPGVKFHHCTEKIAAPNRMMHRAPAAATWAELENGEYDHSDNANGTHIWVKAVKESPVNEATIESPEFWQFILPEGITTGIDSVAAEESGEVELYNLQGVRVDRRSAAPGLYIERRGGKVAKVVL